jgi:hypothetical protein
MSYGFIGNWVPPESFGTLLSPPIVVAAANWLRQGLDISPAQPYFLHEEEVPRAGARVTQYFERTRWTQGEVFTWLRVQKQTGHGEATSGLAFDRLVDKNGNEG